MANIRLDQTAWNQVQINQAANVVAPDHYDISDGPSEERKLTVWDVEFSERINLIFSNYGIFEFKNCTFDHGSYFESQMPDGQHANGGHVRFEKCKIRSFHTQFREFNPLEAVARRPLSIQLGFVDCLELDEIDINRYVFSLTIANSSPQKNQIRSIKLDDMDQGNSLSLDLQNYNVDSLIVQHYAAVSINVEGCAFKEFSISCANFSGAIEGSELPDTNLDGVHHFHIMRSIVKRLSIKGGLNLLKLSGLKADLVELLQVSGAGQIIIEGASDLGIFAVGKVAVKDISITDAVIGRVILPLKLMSFASLSMNGTENNKLKIGQLIFFKGLFQDPNSKDKTSVSLELIELLELSFVSVVNNANFFASDVVGVSSRKQKYVNIDPSPDYTSLLSDHGIEIPVFYCFRSYFQVVSSDLGKVNFVSCNFSIMPMLIMASKINEIFLSGTQMPKILQGNYENVQVGYGQLKKVYDSRGDSIASGEYLKYELEAHYYSLKQIISEGRWSQTQFWDFISLGLNRFTNDFGTSWARAALIFFVSMIVLYIFHNRALGFSLGPYFYPVVWTNFSKIFGLFPEFIFPIHKADYIPGELKMPVTNWSRFWDTIGKVWGGYLIYQFVQAFRKYGKK